MTNASTNPSNVTPITDRHPQPACRFTITCALDGFPIEIQGEGRAGDLKVIIDRLKSIGAEPPAPQNLQTPEPTKPAGVPVCPVHRTPMKLSRKPGAFYCAKRADDGEYCRETA